MKAEFYLFIFYNQISSANYTVFPFNPLHLQKHLLG